MVDVKNFALNSTEKLEAEIKAFAETYPMRGQKIRIMPDGHAGGKGKCTVGATFTFGDMLNPQAVGCDIACSVTAFRLPVRADDIDFEKLDNVVHTRVPRGESVHSEEVQRSKDFEYFRFHFWHNLTDEQRRRAGLSMGTLGGGNHFLSIEQDDDDNCYMVVHCGTRSMGIYAFNYYMEIAEATRKNEYEAQKKRMKDGIDQLKKMGLEDHIQRFVDLMIEKTHIDTPYLTRGPLRFYLEDLKRCEEWVFDSHMSMFDAICQDMGWNFDQEFDIIHSVHNTVDTDRNIVRKGATSAEKGQLGIVPLNMGDGSLIVRGKGNPDWLYSLPHGAGRLMGRAEARRNLSMDDYREAMKGIYTTCVRESTIDESPMSYKNADEIARAIEPNGEVVARMRPLYNYKAV